MLLRRSSGEYGGNSGEAMLVPKRTSCTGERHWKSSLNPTCVGGVPGHSDFTEGLPVIQGLNLRQADGRGEDANGVPRNLAWISGAVEGE